MEYEERNCWVILEIVTPTEDCPVCKQNMRRMATHISKSWKACYHPDCVSTTEWIKDHLPGDKIVFGICMDCFESKNDIIEIDEGFRLTVIKKFPTTRNAKNAYKI